MAESYAFCSSPCSQPSSPPPGGEVKDASEDDPSWETELFEDTLVLNIPFSETEVENLDLNTELVEDSDPEEKMTTGPICEYEQQVVLDSEDEEMNNKRVTVIVAKEFLEDKTSPIVKNPLIRFQNRHAKPLCEQADSNATTRGKSATGDKGTSIDAESFEDSNNHQYQPARLNHIHSPEPEDSTEAALGFVDQYLSSNDVDLSQGILHTKTTRQKSPHVPSAKGSLSLAKKIKARTKNEEKEPFKWVASDQNDNKAGIFCKQYEASSNFGRYKQTYARRRKRKTGQLLSQGNGNTGTRSDGKSVFVTTRMTTEKNNSPKEFDINSCVAHLEDMSDIGLDTQIAAEAMDALAYGLPTGCNFNDAHQPENAFAGSVSDLTENEARPEIFSYRQNPGLHSITTKSIKRTASSYKFSKVMSSSSCKHSVNQESNPVSGNIKKMIKSKSTIGGNFENNTGSSVCSKHVSLEKVCSMGEYMSVQPEAKDPKIWNNESRCTRIKDQPSQHTERNNGAKDKGIISPKTKENALVADPAKLGARTKRLKLPTNSSGVARKSRLNHQVKVIPQLYATGSFQGIDSWVYPKGPRGKRKRVNAQINLIAPTDLCIDGKESYMSSTRSLGGQDDVDKSCFLHTRPLCNTSCVEDDKCLLQGNFVQQGSAGNTMKFENLHDTQPLLIAHVEIPSNKIDFANEDVKISNADHTHNEHHKKPCDKNLPKSSLLKELIKLGVPESTSDMIWKDLRHRRDMKYVRVLFSQHLDDSIIKQQKKILARLNIFVASSSGEATHFIADKFTRTKNMLETMALGKLVVTHLWLESCGQANCFIDEKNYILRDMKKEKEIGFSMPVSLARARQKPLLKGKRVYITPHIKPDMEVVANLVTAVHGQVVDESQICADKNVDNFDDLLILSCENDYAICNHFLKRGTAVYSSELVLNGIVTQKLELERHQLFKNQVTGNSLSTSNRYGKVYKRHRGIYLDHS